MTCDSSSLAIADSKIAFAPIEYKHFVNSDTSFYYIAHGLRIVSNLPIPGLATLSFVSEPDVKVLLGKRPDWMPRALETALSLHISQEVDIRGNPLLRYWQIADGQYFRLLYADGTEFVLDLQGTQIWADWSEPMTLEDTATYLLGPVLGFLLRLRGKVCLHAGAVAINGNAIVMLGSPGAGKSTTTAAFTQAGYKVLSDDIVALEDNGDNFLVQPSYPRIRLWPSSVGMLCGANDALPSLTPNWDKRYLDLSAEGLSFQGQPLPLAAVYILAQRCDTSAAPFIEALPANETLISLVTNTYTNYLLDKAMRAREFDLLGRMVKCLPIRRIVPHTDPQLLSKLCTVITDDFLSLIESEVQDNV